MIYKSILDFTILNSNLLSCLIYFSKKSPTKFLTWTIQSILFSAMVLAKRFFLLMYVFIADINKAKTEIVIEITLI